MPFLMSLGIGLSLNNLHAVLEALFHRESEFRRTPKYRIEGTGGEWRSKKYRASGNYSLVAEILLAAYFLAATVFAAVQNYWVGVPFLLVFFNGFAYTSLLSTFSRSGPIPFTGHAAEPAHAARPGVEAAPGA